MVGWKFWEKKAPPAAQQALEWPTDSLASVKMLITLYISEVPPFNQWRADDAQLTPETEKIAEIGSRGLPWARGSRSSRASMAISPSSLRWMPSAACSTS